MDRKKIRVALAGNPNVGKTSLFNALTGARQHVGNWPGVTVEKKTGKCTKGGHEFEIVDLPGIYGLSAYSLDEEVARDYLVQERPDVVVNIVDATNLERNLYLSMQLLELGMPVVLALNMADRAEERGFGIDIPCLSERLGVPIVQTVASKGIGIDALLDAMARRAEGTKAAAPPLPYPGHVESSIASLVSVLEKDPGLTSSYPVRTLAVLLLESDPAARRLVEQSTAGASAQTALSSIDTATMEIDIVDARYGRIRSILNQSCTVPSASGTSLTDVLDTVLTDKYLGIPLFLSLMWGAFMLTFTFAEPFMEGIDWVFGWLIGLVSETVGNEALASLLGDGILGGVGSVLIFVPNIFILFFILAILEDSGYLARAAFVMDRAMARLGLHGKSFVPMLMGFGCSVPAIMACRTIENRSDRMVTILSAPFITCGARLPVYILFAGAFFGAREGTVVFALYVLSILVAIGSAKLLRSAVFRGETSPFILEMPEYGVPTLKGSLLHMWERGAQYLRKAGTVIFVGVIAIWALASLPWGVEYGAADSVVGSIGRAIEPLVRPLGFDWKLAVALIFGFVAKEVVVASLGVLYGTGEDMLPDAIKADPAITPLDAMGFMVFSLIYSPCIAAVAVIKKETGSWKWMGVSILYSTVLAWVAAFAVRHIGLALGY